MRCCAGKTYAGPSGVRRRHTCARRRGEPYLSIAGVLPSTFVHPACKAAAAEGATPCARCIPLLHAATCDCDVCNDWWSRTDDEDDARGGGLWVTS